MTDNQTLPKPHFAKPGVPKFPATNLRLKLLEKRMETTDIITFCFKVEREDGHPFYHHPGQALSVHIPLPEDKLLRTFTIASAPNRQERIELTIKATASAYATRYMHDELQPGCTLSARGPFGDFSLVHHPQKPLLLVGAGSGMTPVMSMLRWLYQRREQVNVVLIQQASRPSDLLFTEELHQIDAEMPNLLHVDGVSTVDASTSTVPASKASDGQAWTGRLQHSGLRTLVPDLGQRTVFCCGPEGFTESIRAIYRAEGGLPENFQTETFGASSGLLVDSMPVDLMPVDSVSKPSTNAGDSYQIDIDGHRFFAKPSQNLVDAAAESGIRIPTSCREGNCGTCKLKLVQGDIKMEHQGGLSDKDERQGYLLACSSWARSDLVLTRKKF